MSAVAQAATAPALTAEQREYLVRFGVVDPDPRWLEPEPGDTFSVFESPESPFKPVGPHVRPEMDYRRLVSAEQLRAAEARGWHRVPPGSVWLLGCRSEAEIIVCRPTSWAEADRRRRRATVAFYRNPRARAHDVGSELAGTGARHEFTKATTRAVELDLDALVKQSQRAAGPMKGDAA